MLLVLGILSQDTTIAMAVKTSRKKWIGVPSMDLYCNHPKSLILSNTSELFWSWISKNHIQVKKEKKSLHFACSCLSYSVKLGIFMSWKRIRGQRNIQKSLLQHAELLFDLFNLLLFWHSCCRFHHGIPIIFEWQTRKDFIKRLKS